ncbi:MAG: hypothetical protein MR743_03750 [Oscillospiraceae bacterium]|nr:hypothetical protein [Oscillospiraceae bacterium]
MTVSKYNVLIAGSLTAYPNKSTALTVANLSTMFALEAMIAKRMDLIKRMKTAFAPPAVQKHFFTKKDT